MIVGFQFDQQLYKFDVDYDVSSLPVVITQSFHVLNYLKKGGSGSIFTALNKVYM